MRKVIYSMSVSLDGFIAGPAGEIDWGGPDDELHRFHNDRVREQGAQLLGRRLYETMLYWEGYAEREPEATETTLENEKYFGDLDSVVGDAMSSTIESSPTEAKSSSQ